MVSAIMSKAKLHGLLIDVSYREVSEQKEPMLDRLKNWACKIKLDISLMLAD
jgi:hypothetical protein